MFKKKETLLQNMTFMGVIAAINVILCALGAYLTITGVFIVIFLPFLSAAVTIVCKKKYYPIYAFATILVAVVATLWNSQFTIFYLVPSTITGFLFGLCFSLKINGTYSILFTSIIQLGIAYLTLPIIKLIYDQDVIMSFIKLFNLESRYDYVRFIVPSFIYLISLVQMIFTYIIIKNELKKFDPNLDKENNKPYINLVGLCISLLVTPFVFFDSTIQVAYLFMFIALFISTASYIDIILVKNKKLIIVFSILFIVGFLLIFILNKYVNETYRLLLINVSNILIFTSTLIYNKKVC